MRTLRLLFAVLALGVVVAPPAAATPSAIRTPAPQAFALTATGFDPAVAARHGYPTTAPTDVRQSNCGYSYLFLDPIPRGLIVRTGFEVNEPAVGYVWTVDVYGPSGFQKRFEGQLPGSPRWDGDPYRKTGLTPGRYDALVTRPADTILADGRVCSSTGPAESLPVF